MDGERHSRSDSISSSSYLVSPTGTDSAILNGTHGLNYSLSVSPGTNEVNQQQPNREWLISNGTVEHPDVRLPNGGNLAGGSSVSEAFHGSKESGPFQDGENVMRSKNSPQAGNGNQVEAEWIEQYEQGVYITLVALRDGTRDLKRVRFRYCQIFQQLLLLLVLLFLLAQTTIPPALHPPQKKKNKNKCKRLKLSLYGCKN